MEITGLKVTGVVDGQRGRDHPDAGAAVKKVQLLDAQLGGVFCKKFFQVTIEPSDWNALKLSEGSIVDLRGVNSLFQNERDASTLYIGGKIQASNGSVNSGKGAKD